MKKITKYINLFTFCLASTCFAYGGEENEAARAQVNITGELAITAINSTNLVRNALRNSLETVQGGKKDFLSAQFIGAHTHQKAREKRGYKDDLYGGLISADKRVQYNDASMRYGIVASYLRSDLDCFGNELIYKGQNARQDIYSGALYGAYETYDVAMLKTNINLLAGSSYMRNKIYRNSPIGHTYRASFSGLDLFASLEITRSLWNLGGWQIGPWAECSYHHLHQRQYAEQAPNSIIAQTLRAVDYDVMNTILGLNFERNFLCASNSGTGLKAYAKVGWNCRPIGKHHTKGTLREGQIYEPRFQLNDRHAVTTAIGFCNHLSKKWDIVGNWQGNFSGNYAQNCVSLGFGCQF